MKTRSSVTKYFIWSIIGVYLLLVASTYLSLLLEYGIGWESNLYSLLVLVVNLFLILWVTRTHLTIDTLSFTGILFSISWILFTFNIDFLNASQSIFISFFPSLFFYFFLYFLSSEPFELKESKLYLSILLTIGFIEEFIPASFLGVSIFIFSFFLGFILLVIFCIRIYYKAKNNSLLKWPPSEITKLSLVTILGIAPFILSSIIPNVVSNTQIMENTWTISFILLIPFFMGYLVSKHNLIIHRYWKISLITSFIGILLILALIWGILYITSSPTFFELLVISHFFVLIGFVIQILVTLYTNYRKKIVQENIGDFLEEREHLTYYQLRNRLVRFNLELSSEYWKHKWQINSITLSDKSNKQSSILFKIEDCADIVLTEDPNAKNINRKLEIELKNQPYILQVARFQPFSAEEVAEITSELKIWLAFFVEQEQLLHLKREVENRTYTSLERASYLQEMKLIDYYNNRVSNYLHDDIQQYIYYIKQVIYSGSSLEGIRKQVEHTIAEMEHSIQLSTVEWMGYPADDKKIDRLIYELSITLEKHLSSDIALDMDLDVVNFEKERADIKSLLYRAIKECMVNTYKHAQAKNLLVSLNKQDQNWRVIVEDDGIGWEGDLRTSTRYGLVSLQRQVELLEGEMTIRSKQDNGFKVNIYLPNLEGE